MYGMDVLRFLCYVEHPMIRLSRRRVWELFRVLYIYRESIRCVGFDEVAG